MALVVSARRALGRHATRRRFSAGFLQGGCGCVDGAELPAECTDLGWARGPVAPALAPLAQRPSGDSRPFPYLPHPYTPTPPPRLHDRLKTRAYFSFLSRFVPAPCCHARSCPRRPFLRLIRPSARFRPHAPARSWTVPDLAHFALPALLPAVRPAATTTSTDRHAPPAPLIAVAPRVVARPASWDLVVAASPVAALADAAVAAVAAVAVACAPPPRRIYAPSPLHRLCAPCPCPASRLARPCACSRHNRDCATSSGLHHQGRSPPWPPV